jgi:hypothetical protein
MNTDLLRKIAVMKLIKAEYEAKVTAINAQLPVLCQKAHELFMAEGTKSITLEPTMIIDGKEVTVFKDGRGRIVKPSLNPKPAIKDENKATVYQWFKDNGQGSIVKETVHHASLVSWVKAQREANKPIPELITVFDIEDITITKAAKTKAAK